VKYQVTVKLFQVGKGGLPPLCFGQTVLSRWQASQERGQASLPNLN
jgi:hypothetical protein